MAGVGRVKCTSAPGHIASHQCRPTNTDEACGTNRIKTAPADCCGGWQRAHVRRPWQAGSRRSSLLSACPCLIVTSWGKRFPAPVKRCRLLLLLLLLIQLYLYSLPTPVPLLVPKKRTCFCCPSSCPSLCFFFLILLPTACCLLPAEIQLVRQWSLSLCQANATLKWQIAPY